MENCIFCKIIRNELPCFRVFEDDAALAFLDIAPFAKGHTLVIPRVHVATLPELPQDILARLIQSVQHVSRLVASGLACHGFNLLQNNGACAGQSVPHVHFHIVPRYDNGPVEWIPDPKRYAPGEAAAVAAKIGGAA